MLYRFLFSVRVWEWDRTSREKFFSVFLFFLFHAKKKASSKKMKGPEVEQSIKRLPTHWAKIFRSAG